MTGARIQPGIPRWLEAAVASAALVVLSPVMAAVAVAVWISSPGPVLFRQARVGRGGRAFTMLKFRSMRVRHAGPHNTSKDDGRVTAVGRWLRKSKLDELPELWNVLRGDMSLVGPRPEVTRFVDLHDSRWTRILACRPGISDPVTLRLRNEEELMANVEGDREVFYRDVLQPYKLEGYAAYLDHRSFWTDVGVLFWSVVAVVLPRTTPPPTLSDLTSSNADLHRSDAP